MKRYLLFAYDVHDAVGGFHDFVKSADTITELKDNIGVRINNRCPGFDVGLTYKSSEGPQIIWYDSVQIVDGLTGEIITIGYEGKWKD